MSFWPAWTYQIGVGADVFTAITVGVSAYKYRGAQRELNLNNIKEQRELNLNNIKEQRELNLINIKEQEKERSQSQKQYLAQSLTDNLKGLFEKKKEWIRFSAEWRLPITELSFLDAGKEASNKKYESIFKTLEIKKIIFLEQLLSDLEYQENVFNKIFLKDIHSEIKHGHISRCKELIVFASNGNAERDAYTDELCRGAGAEISKASKQAEISRAIEEKYPSLESQVEKFLDELLFDIAKTLDKHIE